MINEIIGMTVLACLGWFWFDSLGAREAGVLAVRKACRAENLQLLDETIALRCMRLRRNEEGRMILQRIYDFEYSDTGDDRHRGSVHLSGAKITLIDIGDLWMVSHERGMS